jgi:hypothetical protein
MPVATGNKKREGHMHHCMQPIVNILFFTD